MFEFLLGGVQDWPIPLKPNADMLSLCRLPACLLICIDRSDRRGVMTDYCQSLDFKPSCTLMAIYMERLSSNQMEN